MLTVSHAEELDKYAESLVKNMDSSLLENVPSIIFNPKHNLRQNLFY